jgi:hypothetical protein
MRAATHGLHIVGHQPEPNPCAVFPQVYNARPAFKGMLHGQIVAAVAAGQRPVFPDTAPPAYAALAQACWAAEPEARPAFPEIMAALCGMLVGDDGGGEH